MLFEQPESLFFTSSMGCHSDYNCSSSRGSCEKGICVCSVQFAGENCTQTNTGFTAAFSSIFSVLFLVTLIQLVVCIQSEYHRMKHASLWAACRVTTQKFLYFLVLIAALTRILYFSLMGVIPDKWLETMELAYHPFLITGMSLVVCYWSEAFFLEDVSMDASRRACFLSKSFVAFSIFNLILYLMVIAQFIVVATNASGLLHVDHWLNGAFQSIFAILLFILYIVFMTVGVEMFFKVRGAFNLRGNEASSSSHASNEDGPSINSKEVLKSRLALLFQALFILLMVLCVVSNAVETLWRDKVAIRARSLHAVVYRVAEVCAVLWFPCVLWNTTSPEQLWFLNPRCLLSRCHENERLVNNKRRVGSYSTFEISHDDEEEPEDDGMSECWICYDSERTDAGSFIKPCLCKGGMSSVHHDCLRKWLIQHPDVEEATCSVCKHPYSIQQDGVNVFQVMLMADRRAIVMVAMVAIAVAAPCVAMYVYRNCNNLDTYVKVIVLGMAIILELVCFKVLGLNFSRLFQITRLSALRILNYSNKNNHVENKPLMVSSPKRIHSEDVTINDIASSTEARLAIGEPQSAQTFFDT